MYEILKGSFIAKDESEVDDINNELYKLLSRSQHVDVLLNTPQISLTLKTYCQTYSGSTTTLNQNTNLGLIITGLKLKQVLKLKMLI
jgi:hypothetical protein